MRGLLMLGCALGVAVFSCTDVRTSESRGALNSEDAARAVARLDAFTAVVAPATGQIESVSGGWTTTTTARVSLGSPGSTIVPEQASTPFHVRSGEMGIDVRLRQLSAGLGTLISNQVVYAGAIGSAAATYYQRPNGYGTEDYTILEAAPPNAAVDYDVTLGEGVAGLRVVDGVVEFVDGAGTPRIRMGQPRLEGQDGTVVVADVSVTGCAVDRSPAAPWGRPVVAPIGSQCAIHIAWAGRAVAYPAVLDPSWVATGAMVYPSRRYHGATVLSDGRVLVSGGATTGSVAVYPTAELFDPGTKTWAATDTMPNKLAWHTSTLLTNGKVAVAGGVSGSGAVQSTTYLYDPSVGTWTVGAAMPNPHSQHTASLLNDGRVLVVGGFASGSTATARAELYTPSTNTWTPAPNLSIARARHAAELLPDGRALVAGGWTGSATLADAVLFNPTTNSWAATGALLTARADFALTRLGSGLLVASGGVGASGALGSVDLYNGYTGLFTPTLPSLATPRSLHRAVAVGQDALLVVGGNGASGALSSTERWDVETNQWTAEGSLSVAKVGHAAVVLKSGVTLTCGAGGAELWGAPATDGDSNAGPRIKPSWQVTAGTRAASDLLTARMTNLGSTATSVTLKLTSRGLDARESTRTIGTYSVGTSPLDVTFPVSTLPVQPIGTQAEAFLVAEFTNGGSATSFSGELFYEFSAGYASANIYGSTPNPTPAATDMYAYFGSSAGEVVVDVADYLTKLRDASLPAFTLSGRVWNSTTSAFDEVAALARRGGPGGTAWGGSTLMPVFPSFSALAFVVPIPETGPTYSVCFEWNAKFTDSGYGEDIQTSRAVSSYPASYTRATILRKDTARAVWSGALDASGCVSLPLAPSTDYVFSARSNAWRPSDGVVLGVHYSHRTDYQSPRIVPYAIRLGGSRVGGGIASRNGLMLTAPFTTAATGGAIPLSSWFEDALTRSMVVMSRTIGGAESGLVAVPRGYQVYADEGCPNGGSACYSGYSRTFFVGPAPDTIHDSMWKFIVSHEFGHNIASFLYGDVANPYDNTDTNRLCNCSDVGKDAGFSDAYLSALQTHCLNNKQPTGGALVEGWAHFNAARLWNITSEPNCTFVYYKDSVNPDTTVSHPPMARSCYTPATGAGVKWMETYCSSTSMAGKGVEWDWMNFFVGVYAMGYSDRSTMDDLGDIFRRACGGGIYTTPRMCAGDTPNFTNLSLSADAKWGSLDPRAARVHAQGTANGINH